MYVSFYSRVVTLAEYICVFPVVGETPVNCTVYEEVAANPDLEKKVVVEVNELVVAEYPVLMK